MQSLYLYSAGSANDHLNQHLWVQGAALFIPQLNTLLNKTHKGAFEIITLEAFAAQSADTETLGQILEKHGSDKSTKHNYHIALAHILGQLKDAPIKLLEIGMGTNNPELVSSMGADGRPGASLYAFREFLPGAEIYGADIDRNILFQSERIRTAYVNQLDVATFSSMSAEFGGAKFDLIIDDGLHAIGANFNTLLFALENLNDSGWIVVEDIIYIENWKSIDFILRASASYQTYVVKTRYAYLYIVHKLPAF